MKKAGIIIAVLVLVIGAIQFFPSGIPANSPDTGKSILAGNPESEAVMEQLKTSCFDCHSNQVSFPWYSKLAPVSWMLASHINEGRSYLNFSEWEEYSKREKIGKLEDIKKELSSGGMPLKSYLLMHREAKPDSAAVSAIIKWADETAAKILE